MFFYLFLIVFIAVFIYYKNAYYNPYRVILFIGNKGSGKSTNLTKESISDTKKGWRVYSNYSIFNTYELNINDIGKRDFPENSTIMIDEAGIVFDNRKFKEFKPEWVTFFKNVRKKKLKVILASQGIDIDRKILLVCDEIYLFTNFFGFISVGKRIKRKLVLHNSKDPDSNVSSENFINDDYTFYPIWNWKFTFIPRYAPFFDSFEVKEKLEEPVETEKFRFTDLSLMYELISFKGFLKHSFLHMLDVCSDQIKLWSLEFIIPEIDFYFFFPLLDICHVVDIN